MQLFRRAPGNPGRLGVLPGSFNPPTRAHLALASAALQCADEVLLVLPRTLPHKCFEGANFQQRLEMLLVAAESEPRCSVAASDGGLFIEIAEECRQVYGDRTKLAFICGQDAAERIASWPYEGTSFADMLLAFELLVAPRQRDYCPPEPVRDRIHALALAEDFRYASASEVRRLAARHEPWEHLVPDRIVPLVRAIYGANREPV